MRWPLLSPRQVAFLRRVRDAPAGLDCTRRELTGATAKSLFGYVKMHGPAQRDRLILVVDPTVVPLHLRVILTDEGVRQLAKTEAKGG